MPTRRDRRRGFTLLELMVALVLTMIVLAGAHRLAQQIEDAGVLLSRDARRADARANGDRLLRDLLGRVEATRDTMRAFVGGARTTAFDSWCDEPAGWQERCRVTLTLSASQDSTVMAASFDAGESALLRTYAGDATFRYLRRDSAGVTWLDGWGRGITVPFAVGIVHDDDTSVVHVGGRG